MMLDKINNELAGLRAEIKNHKVYQELQTVTDITVFMESHIYAVWDFMSLLKALQLKLTGQTLPWKPVTNANTARFINEIVLEEETDIDEQGLTKSHFEMYLDAMNEVGADTRPIHAFLQSVSDVNTINKAIKKAGLPEYIADFLNFTFSIISTGEPHKIAAAFTFGREDVIPDMFLGILEKSNKNYRTDYRKLTYYLQRHIDLDGEEHGPLALKMIQELCGNDTKKWDDVLIVAKQALTSRIKLWNGVYDNIAKEKLETA
ncbi:Hypothetical protein I595_3070 [Croceitalea dokdonensis DOKDO 023]|uniref:Heme oxygenase n=1 Tax=Croceitalea dokdonensis DOKDO 023 TaxID=1300341 RepID=A0A0P7AGH5_9FLAO|nr:DUF3050 domain-containing protein [Croceitalea dokdonensis]KPM31091.1 Hypothetical protein I595_3070 [Croceitalea dokdonensis DOKDO 023]